MQNYITVADGLGWHWIQLCGMAVTIIVSLCLCYYMHGGPLIHRQYKKDYKYLAVFVIFEIFIGESLFNNDVAGNFIRGEYILFSTIVFVCLFSLLSAIIFYKGYKDMRYQQQISDMNFEMLKKQYETIQKMYTEKRMMLHDSVHQDVLMLEYLENGKYREAQMYFEKKLAVTKKKSKNRYTGIEVLNLMLNYEIEQAEEKTIRVNCAVEAYLCPVDETELCIIMGNLFDNAIEAVKDLPDEQRQIDFAIQNPNGIFRIEILNPYEGERRKIEHHYLTTKKENTEMHGLGLMSVQKIVEKYDGLIEISDEDNVFRVVVSFYDEEVRDSAGT
ncbi:MAG: ATP-binding protein [Coprococcus sp.]|uniref:ATP-binding protein n=1 Tax=Coprococcus catus TaxID=116085 RepID=UPI001C029337|nr:ATP-binding protein [Coprococcus catus]